MSGQLISSQNLMIYYLKSRLASNGEKNTNNSQSWKLYNKHANTQNEIDENSRYPVDFLNFQFPITIIYLKKGPLKLLKWASASGLQKGLGKKKKSFAYRLFITIVCKMSIPTSIKTTVNQSTIHWMPVITHLWMNLNWVNT